MPPKRPTKAIKIVNPNPPQQPAALPPAPPLPGVLPTASPRINPGYEHLKSIIENLNISLLPNPEHTFQAHSTAQAVAQRKPKSSSKKTRTPSMQKEEGENLTSQTDPLLYALTNIFLSHKKETTTFLERFEALYANTTQEEWDLTSKWKICTEMNAHTLKTLHAQHGPDAVVSLAMKRWVQRALGLTLEEIFASQTQHANQHPIGLSAVYSGDPLAPPVYHYSEQQMYNTYPSFPYRGVYGNRNRYHPQRTPLPPLRNSQSQSVLPRGPFVPSRNQNTLHHSASLPAFPRAPAPAPAPNSDNKEFKYKPKLPVTIEVRPQRRPVARATSPVPNPSGRNTPPHKRSPKKKKKLLGTTKAGRTRMDVAHGSSGSTGYDSQTGKSVFSRSNKWVKGKGAPSDDEGSSAVIQPQYHAAETTTRALTKGKEKEHATNYADSGEGSSMGVIDTATSQLVVKTLPNGKKQILAKAMTVASTGDGSSIIYDPQIPGWKKVNAQPIPKPAQNPQSTNPGNRDQTLVCEDLQTTTLGRDINGPGTNATVKGSNRVEAGDRVSLEVKSSGTAINQVPTKQPAHGHLVTRASMAAKMLVEKWAKERQHSERGYKDQILSDVEGSFSDSSQTDVKGKLPTHGIVPIGGPWLTNDPQISGLMTKTSGSSSMGGSKFVCAQGSGENVDSKSLAPVKIPEVPASPQYKEMDQLPPYERAAVMPRTPDSTKLVMDANRKTNRPTVLIPIRDPVPVCPSMFPASPPDYAKAATGMNGKNMDKRTPDRTLSTTPTWKPPSVPVATTKFIATPTKLTASPPAVTSTLAQNIVATSPTSLDSGKSWSSIVARNTSNSNAATKELQRNIATIRAFPELGKPLTTLPSNQLPTAEAGLKKKTSLSATAKPFEPAALRHATSVDSYLRTTNYPTPPTVQQPTPIIQQFPMSAAPVAPVAALRAPADYMDFSFDYLLELFYDTPQFTQYLNRSYNELLFTENYLRAQYQRISIVFEDEWNYITASQRKAVVAKALFNLSSKVDKVQFREGNGVENMLCEMGLAKKFPNTPVIPVLRRAPNSNLREAYIQGASATEKEEEKESAKPTKVAYLKWRAEYCFDLDPDALSITPDWLFSIIAWLLGMPHPLRHRFGPGRYNRGSGASAASDQGMESTPGEPEFWCPDDCSECAESEQTGWSTEWTFVRRDSADPTRKVRHSNLGPSSPMLERFLDEMEIPEGYLPEPAFPNPPGSQKPTSTTPSEGYSPFMFSQPSILKTPRLMSNRFTDSIFHIHNRSDEWKANNPGRAKFMEILNIDTALFYCALIEEILKIFGEVRRERVWFKLPTGADYYDALSWFSNTQSERGRPRARSEGEGSSRIRSMAVKGHGKRRDHRSRSRRAEVRGCVAEEQERVQTFVKEAQRSADWLVGGLKLVNEDTDKEIGKARDGGLWTVPVPPGEKESLEKEFAKLLVWEV